MRRVEKIETALEPRFQAHFVEAMAIPHKTAPLHASARRRWSCRPPKAAVQSDARERRNRAARHQG